MVRARPLKQLDGHAGHIHADIYLKRRINRRTKPASVKQWRKHKKAAASRQQNWLAKQYSSNRKFHKIHHSLLFPFFRVSLGCSSFRYSGGVAILTRCSYLCC